MKYKQLKDLHTWVKIATPSEIVFISALILPLYILLYYSVFSQLQGLNFSDPGTLGVGFGVALYLIGIIWMKNSQSEETKDRKNLSKVINYLRDKGYKHVSYERIKEHDQDLTKEVVTKLVHKYPNELRFANLHDKKANTTRQGIKLLVDIDEEDWVED